MTFAEAGFWFLLGFFVASYLAYKAQIRNQARARRNYSAARAEVLRLLESVKEMTEVRVTIVDGEGDEFTVKTSDADLEVGELEIEEVPKKGLH